MVLNKLKINVIVSIDGRSRFIINQIDLFSHHFVYMRSGMSKMLKHLGLEISCVLF